MRILPSLIITLILLLQPSAFGFDSGRATADLGLAIHDFVINGTDAANEIGLLDRPGLPCKAKGGDSPQKAAANHMRAAALEFRTRRMLSGFGFSMLDAVGDTLAMHPGGKAAGFVVGTLHAFFTSKTYKEFAATMVEDQVRKKVLTEAVGEDFFPFLEGLYNQLTTFKQEGIDEINALKPLELTPNCPPGSATFTVKYDKKSDRIIIRIDAKCKCPPTGGGLEEYHGILEGKLDVGVMSDGKVGWRILGTGMRFWGKCCGRPEPKFRTLGKLVSDGIGEETTTGDDAIPNPGDECTEKDCEEIIKEMKERDKAISELKKLREVAAQSGEKGDLVTIDEQIDQLKSTLEELCKLYDRCDCDKYPVGRTPDVIELFKKICFKEEYGFLPSDQDYIGSENVSYEQTSVILDYDRSDCQFGGGTVRLDLRPTILADAISTSSSVPGGPGTPTDTPSDEPPPPGSTEAPPSTDKPPTTGTPTSETPPTTPSTTTTPPGTSTTPPTTTGSPTDEIPPTTDKPPTTDTTVTTTTPTVSIPGAKPPEEEPSEEEKSTEEPPSEETPPTTVVLIVKATEKVLEEGSTTTQTVRNVQLKIPGVEPDSLPIAGGTRPDDIGFDEDGKYFQQTSEGFLTYTMPVNGGFTDQNGGKPVLSDLPLAGRTFEKEIDVDLTPQVSIIVGFVVVDESNDLDDYLNDDLDDYVKHSFTIGDTFLAVLQFANYLNDQINDSLGNVNSLFVEPNPCRTVQQAPNDPYFLSKSTWKQQYDDQWAIKRVGFTGDSASAWNMIKKPNPVTVAVIDTGLDWNHQDISWDNIWNNPKEVPENGIDDDKNGYVDDIVGYDFHRRSNKPWDQNGHGTFVTGVIAAAHNNGAGIAGINPRAKIMALKALNGFGHTRASYLAEAITYAANNGARVINISVGGPVLTRTEQMAIDYAYEKGAVVVVAAGNEAVDVANFSPAGLRHALTVSSTNIRDQRAPYSNWGAGIDIAAPGDDVLSLRARRTDLMRDVRDVRYTAGEAYVGVDKRYYRASGTSFSAPIVAGTASLILSMNPELTNEEVERMLLQSATDIDVPGNDQHTGFGMIDARGALAADPRFYILAEITEVKVVTEGAGAIVQVNGTADANQFRSAYLELGAGKNPQQWKRVGANLTKPVTKGVLGAIPASEFRGSAQWSVRVVVEHQGGRTRQAWFNLNLQ